MFNGAELLADEQTVFSKHNLLMGTQITPGSHQHSGPQLLWVVPAPTAIGSLCQLSSAGDVALKVGQKISNSLPISVMVLKNKAVGPSVFHFG